MKSLAYGICVAVLGSGLAYGQAAEQRYQGTFFVTEVSPGCTNADGSTTVTLNEHFVWVFRSSNALQSMSVVQQRRAASFSPENQRFGKSGNYTGLYILSSSGLRSASAKYSKFKMTPATLTPTTATVQLEGQLSDFEGAIGCNVTFEAGGVRRPGF